MHCFSSGDSHSRFAEIDRFDADPMSIHRARERADHLHGELQHEFFNRTEAECGSVAVKMEVNVCLLLEPSDRYRFCAGFEMN